MTWTILGASPDLAVFAGVLAGLVFLGIVEYTKPRDPPSRDPLIGVDQRLSLMVAAFFSFIVAAFLFSVVHGDDPSQAKASFAQSLCPCIVLAVGVVQLAVSVALSAQGQHARRAANSVAYGTVAIAVVFLTGIAVSPFFQSQAHQLFGTPLATAAWVPEVIWFGSILLVASPIGVALGLRVQRTLARRRANTTRFNSDWLFAQVKRQWVQVQFAIALDVAAALTLNVLTGSDDWYVYGTWLGQLGVAVALLIAGILIAVISLEVSSSKSESDGQG